MPPSGSGGSQWVELFVQEMMNASDMDDARSRATTALQVLEKSIISRASPETTHNVQKVLISFSSYFLLLKLRPTCLNEHNRTTIEILGTLLLIFITVPRVADHFVPFCFNYIGKFIAKGTYGSCPSRKCYSETSSGDPA